MKSLKNILFFSVQYGKNLGKKWLILLLLFFLPLLLIGCMVGLVITLLLPNEEQPIHLVLVDEDQTEESKMMAQLLLLTIADNQFLTIDQLSSDQAYKALEANEITSFLTFPEGFTDDLYKGRPITLQLMGSPAKVIDGFIVKELINSLAQYIESAQANILTIYDYAEQIPLPEDQFQTFMYEQFMNFTMYTLGKGNLIGKEEIKNIATNTPATYYSVAAIFVLLSIWLLGIYLLLRKEESEALQIRMRLLDVKDAERMIVRACWALVIADLMAILLFICIYNYFQLSLVALDFIRLFLFSLLYSACYLLVVLLVDACVSSMRISLVIQCILLFLGLLCSGATIPTLYFPLAMQAAISTSFFYTAFSWIIDIAIEGRNYAEYQLLAVTIIILFVLFMVIERLKDRWQT